MEALKVLKLYSNISMFLCNMELGEMTGLELLDEIKEDGSMTYMLCSTVDDIDCSITHVIRGEDHVTNTAIQIQLFEALGASHPYFAHLSLVKSEDDKISKRTGGFEIASLKENGFEGSAINSFFTFLGSSIKSKPCKDIQQILEIFDITSYSTSPSTYRIEELEHLNKKLLSSYTFDEISGRLSELGLDYVKHDFWLSVRDNINKLSDVADWWKACYSPSEVELSDEDRQFLHLAAEHLPEAISADSWSKWTKEISELSGRKGKSLFMPLRLAITGEENGPELQKILLLIPRVELLARLKK
jgi:glutamyl-tRNA synthetase